MKVFFRNIHLYLSLAAGLVIMTCCFSGAVLVFEKELQELFNHDRYFVNQQNLQQPLEKLVLAVKEKYPTAKVGSIKVYTNPERSLEIGVSLQDRGKKGEKEGAKPAKQKEASAQQATTGQENKSETPTKSGKEKQPPRGAAGRATHTVFVNPYTAQILDLYSYRETFYFKMFSLHRWLLGGEDTIGKTITGVSTFLFLFILITGIVLWWPKNKAILKQRLRIKSNGSFKRLNHDLHVVLGFYSAIFLFIFAFTALAWSFKWFNEGIYKVTASSMKPYEVPHSAQPADQTSISYDSAFVTVSNIAGDVDYYSLRAPSDATGAFAASVLPIGRHEGALDNYYLDQYTGKVIGSQKFSERNLGQRVRSTFKPVHVGSIYGLPSKIIAFIVCLLGVTFPITGVIMWLKRLQKQKRKASKVVRTSTSKVATVNGDYEEDQNKSNKY